MPKLAQQTGNNDVQQQHIGAFQFSAIRPDKLGGVEWTLVNVAFDISASITGHQHAITNALKEALKSCQRSPRANNLVARVSGFGSHLHELHGYMPLHSLDLNQYKPLPLEGSTSLYDAMYAAIGSAHKYSKDLLAMGMAVNCVSFFITDGVDNSSRMGTQDVRTEIARALKAEETESHLTVLIGVNLNDTTVRAALDKVQKDCGIDQFVDIGQADDKNLAKLASFVSRSISSQSQSLGSGGPSQPLQI